MHRRTWRQTAFTVWWTYQRYERHSDSGDASIWYHVSPTDRSGLVNLIISCELVGFNRQGKCFIVLHCNGCSLKLLLCFINSCFVILVKEKSWSMKAPTWVYYLSHPVIVTTRITTFFGTESLEIFICHCCWVGGRSKVYWHCNPIVSLGSLATPYMLLRTGVDSLQKTTGISPEPGESPQMRETSWTWNINWNFRMMVWKVCGHIVHGSLINASWVSQPSKPSRKMGCKLKWTHMILPSPSTDNLRWTTWTNQKTTWQFHVSNACCNHSLAQGSEYDRNMCLIFLVN